MQQILKELFFSCHFDLKNHNLVGKKSFYIYIYFFCVVKSYSSDEKHDVGSKVIVKLKCIGILLCLHGCSTKHCYVILDCLNAYSILIQV